MLLNDHERVLLDDPQQNEILQQQKVETKNHPQLGLEIHNDR